MEPLAAPGRAVPEVALVPVLQAQRPSRQSPLLQSSLFVQESFSSQGRIAQRPDASPVPPALVTTIPPSSVSPTAGTTPSTFN